ncbi:MAG: SDR family oxidoreductase [Bacteroidales bacterium]|nr:SDR family oxidoreductase [Bacteroidales bacterium]
MNIVITGASKGIGLELTKLFINDKENTVIGIARSESLLSNLKNKCKENDLDNFKPVFFDLSKLDEIESGLITEIKKYINSIDILINNAGCLINKPFLDNSIEDIQKMVNINFLSPSIVIQSLIPLLKNGTTKHVINISSMGGYQGSAKFNGLSFYSASKAAIANLTESLAEEFKDDNIKFNCLALGAVNTEMLKSAFPNYEAPLQAHEMAQFIYNFALENHKYINGKIIPISVSTP